MAGKSVLVSAIISGILCLVHFASLRFLADWFTTSQLNTILGGFVGSWVFIFSLTSVSNIEMLVFGEEFQSKLVPEIIFCEILAVIASGVVHRVCATTCIIFSIIGLYFINRISSKHHSKGIVSSAEPVPVRKAGGKKHK